MNNDDKHNKSKEFEARAIVIEKNICWWENELDSAAEEYESLMLLSEPDSDKLKECEKRVKSLLSKAEFEKREMAKLEKDINTWAVESAFEGRFSRSKRKNG